MYGTIANLRLKPGLESRLQENLREQIAENIPGLVASQVFRTDGDPNGYVLVVSFTSREAYQANAASPEQHARYLRFRELLAADPEWHDGEIVYAHPSR
jgi:heme-degrading monooxygenase HmoA